MIIQWEAIKLFWSFKHETAAKIIYSFSGTTGIRVGTCSGLCTVPCCCTWLLYLQRSLLFQGYMYSFIYRQVQVYTYRFIYQWLQGYMYIVQFFISVVQGIHEHYHLSVVKVHVHYNILVVLGIHVHCTVLYISSYRDTCTLYSFVYQQFSGYMCIVQFCISVVFGIMYIVSFFISEVKGI